MKKLLLLVAVSLGYCSYSYSEIIYGSSGNAAVNGQQWVMANVIPQYTGLAVNGVVYRYTTVKNTEDPMVVSVQNENAIDGGYIFREVDDWSGLPGNTINKIVPVDYIPVEYWGDGEIVVEGEGKVLDPSVVYTYRYDDKCIDPQANPSCPGYVREIPEQEQKLELAGETYQDQLDRENVFREEDEQRRDWERMKDKEKKKRKLQELEALLGKFSLNELQGPSERLHQQMVALNISSPAYERELPDPGYEESIELIDSELPDNKQGRRLNYANDMLHDQMVDLQYQGEK